MKTIQSIAVAALLLLCVTTSAHALYDLWPPSGWASGRIYVGQTSTASGAIVLVGYRTNRSGAGTCTWFQIGEAGAFYERTRVHGSAQGDDVLVVSVNAPLWVCNRQLYPIGPQKLEIYTEGGNDVVEALFSNGNLQVDLGSGDDAAAVNGAYLVRGGDGQDWLIDIGEGVDSMYGGASSDLLCAYDSPINLMDGGSGSDARWGFAANMTSIENLAQQSDCAYGLDFVFDEAND